ncbi:Hypothetical_protein [Hexamita inflata]|uniref:Hypothetical_protein n=1 Tax=Hexamita inflata TaxID=28002 RepID=A0AA86TJH6_9EUKA|nr:Hypothetical protein HINF_LOCUS6975 [Hexamita inflata]
MVSIQQLLIYNSLIVSLTSFGIKLQHVLIFNFERLKLLINSKFVTYLLYHISSEPSFTHCQYFCTIFYSYLSYFSLFDIIGSGNIKISNTYIQISNFLIFENIQFTTLPRIQTPTRLCSDYTEEFDAENPQMKSNYILRQQALLDIIKHCNSLNLKIVRMDQLAAWMFDSTE